MTLAVPIDVPQRRAGLRQAIGAEWAKLTTLRSTKWALLITFAGAILVTFLSTRGARHQNASFYQGFDPTNQALAGLALGSLVIGILGVLSMTGEYGSGTIRSSLTATPRRAVFFGAKAIVMGTFALAIGLVLSFLSFFEGQAVLSGAAPTATLGDPGVLRALLESGVFLALAGLVRARNRRDHPPQCGRHRDLRGMHAPRPRPASTTWPGTRRGSCPCCCSATRSPPWYVSTTRCPAPRPAC